MFSSAPISNPLAAAGHLKDGYRGSYTCQFYMHQMRTRELVLEADCPPVASDSAAVPDLVGPFRFARRLSDASSRLATSSFDAPSDVISTSSLAGHRVHRERMSPATFDQHQSLRGQRQSPFRAGSHNCHTGYRPCLHNDRPSGDSMNYCTRNRRATRASSYRHS